MKSYVVKNTSIVTRLVLLKEIVVKHTESDVLPFTSAGHQYLDAIATLGDALDVG
jgi:hypothetical protein